jgi:hypothetical protein
MRIEIGFSGDKLVLNSTGEQIRHSGLIAAERRNETLLSDNSRRNRYCTAPEKKDSQGTSQVVA